MKKVIKGMILAVCVIFLASIVKDALFLLEFVDYPQLNTLDIYVLDKINGLWVLYGNIQRVFM